MAATETCPADPPGCEPDADQAPCQPVMLQPELQREWDRAHVRDRLQGWEHVARKAALPCEQRACFAIGNPVPLIVIHEMIVLIPSDFVVHSFRPPMEEAMSRLWSQLG